MGTQRRDEHETQSGPSRRRFIGGTATSIAAVALGTPVWAGATLTGCQPRPELPDGLFALGVASGDPRHDSVVLWTRLAPLPLEGGGMPAVDVPVHYEVAADEGFHHVVRQGLTRARPRWGHSVHAVVEGLRPDRWYWYRFRVHDEVGGFPRTSSPGGTRRLPHCSVPTRWELSLVGPRLVRRRHPSAASRADP